MAHVQGQSTPGANLQLGSVKVTGVDVDLLKRVNDRISRIRKCWDYGQLDRVAAADSADFLELDQALWLKKNPAETPEHWAQKEKFTVDLANKVIKDIATTYTSPPARTVVPPPLEAKDSREVSSLVDDGDIDDEVEATSQLAADAVVQSIQETNDWLETHIWSFGEYGLNATLLNVDRWVLWHGSVAIEPRYASNFDGRDVDGVEPVFYRRHEFEVLPFEHDPRRAEAVIWPVRKVKVTDRDLGERSQQIFHYWDGEVFCRLTGWNIDTKQGSEAMMPNGQHDARWQGGMFIHALGYLPIVFVREQMVQDKFHAPGSHVNLKRLCLAINKLKTEHGYILKVQHGYTSVNGKLGNATLAVDGIVELAEGQTLTVQGSGADLPGLQAGIQREIEDLAVTFGLAPGTLVMDPSSAKSGVAIMAENRETERLRKERIPLIWDKTEQRYHRAALDIYRLFSATPDAAPDVDTDVDTVFKPPPGTMNDKALRESLDFESSHGLVSPLDMLRELRPELTEEQARERIERATEASAAPAAEPTEPDVGLPNSTSDFLRGAAPREPLG